MAILMVSSINEDDYHEVLGVVEGMKEDSYLDQFVPMVEETRSGRGEADCQRQICGHAGSGWRGLSRREVPALHGALLLHCVFCFAAFKSKTEAKTLKAIHA